MWSVSVHCKDTRIAVEVGTNKPFNGRIYALGRSETCNIAVINSDKFRLDLTMAGQDCNTQSIVSVGAWGNNLNASDINHPWRSHEWEQFFCYKFSFWKPFLFSNLNVIATLKKHFMQVLISYEWRLLKLEISINMLEICKITVCKRFCKIIIMVKNKVIILVIQCFLVCSSVSTC